MHSAQLQLWLAPGDLCAALCYGHGADVRACWHAGPQLHMLPTPDLMHHADFAYSPAGWTNCQHPVGPAQADAVHDTVTQNRYGGLSCALQATQYWSMAVHQSWAHAVTCCHCYSTFSDTPTRKINCEMMTTSDALHTSAASCRRFWASALRDRLSA